MKKLHGQKYIHKLKNKYVDKNIWKQKYVNKNTGEGVNAP